MHEPSRAGIENDRVVAECCLLDDCLLASANCAARPPCQANSPSKRRLAVEPRPFDEIEPGLAFAK
jgi:hypothetical protein